MSKRVFLVREIDKRIRRAAEGNVPIAIGGGTVLATVQHRLDGPEHLPTTDITDLDATAAAHGLLPKLSGDASDTLRGDGTWDGVGSGLTRDIAFVIDGAGSVISTGVKGDLVIDFACTVLSWTLLADQSGSIVVNVWKDTYANFAPTVADKITASAPPTISSATKGQSSTLTGWTTSIAAGDVLRFNVDSVATITRVTLILKVEEA